MTNLFTLILVALLPAPTGAGTQAGYLKEFTKLQEQSNNLNQEIRTAIGKAKTETERERALIHGMKTLRKKSGPITKKALELVRPHAKDRAAADVLIWILTTHPESTAAAGATDLLIRHHVQDEHMLGTAMAFTRLPVPWAEKLARAVAKSKLPRDKKAQALYTLAQILQSKAQLPRLLPTIVGAQRVGAETMLGQPFLAKLKTMNVDKIEAEATSLYQTIIKKYGLVGVNLTNYGELAKRALFELQHLSLGKVAPEITGEDIDGVKFKLTDYRGKVVVVSFWGNW